LLLGLVAGALGGILSVTWAVPVPGLGLVAIVVGCLVPPRPFGAAGALMGWGLTWAALFLRVRASCDAAECTGPDTTGWLVATGILVLAAIGLLVIGLRRSRVPLR
jgi:LPXTG-motif cell wall-anchored protein